MARRALQEINAGSMADIAFLLLIFFLVTTTMDVDTGIIRMLPPPPPPNQEQIKVKERNVFVVLVNSQDRLMVENKPIDISQLKSETKLFISNPGNDINLPEKTTLLEKKEAAIADGKKILAQEYQNAIDLLGNMEVSKGVISLQNDRGTSYNMYIEVQDALAAAIRELRDELAMEKFGKKYDDLTKENEIEAIQKVIPVAISEAEPKAIGE